MIIDNLKCFDSVRILMYKGKLVETRSVSAHSVIYSLSL